jgi:hypothetical protein
MGVEPPATKMGQVMLFLEYMSSWEALPPLKLLVGQ